MTKFESSEKIIKVNRSNVYRFISDINNFNALVPGDTVRDFEVDRDGCRFTVDGLGEVGVRVISREPEKKIMFESEGNVPFRINLLIELEEPDPDATLLKLILEADLNMMMKMVAQTPLENGVEEIASRLSDHLNNREWS